MTAGANEIYCGVKITGMKYVTFNGRPGYCSLEDFDQLKTVVELAHSHGASVNFVLNLPFIADILDVLAKSYIRKAARTGIDAFIVSDLGFILLLEKLKIRIPIHVSSFATVRNEEAIAFYSQFNVNRIIAPPDTTLEELRLLVTNRSGIDVEAFAHGQGCSNVNGNCYLFHSYRPQKEEFPEDPLWAKQADKSLVSIGIRNPCMFSYGVTNLNTGATARATVLDAYPFCAFCSLEALMKSGVSALKIEGRCQPLEFQARTAREYASLLDCLAAGEVDRYREQVQRLRSTSPELSRICSQKRCYYQGGEKCI